MASPRAPSCAWLTQQQGTSYLGESVILKFSIKENETKATDTFDKLSIRKGLCLPESQKNFYKILSISVMTSGDNFTASDS